jgi:hypothetical protein
MTEHPVPDEAPDLEYDLAHEASGEPTEHAQQERPSVYVATETEGYDGDYGYDMAHDVPGR